MSRYRDGDATAFDELYARHADRLFRFVLRMSRGRTEADEIAQDVWIAVVRARTTYMPTARFTTFLFSIAHRRCTDRLRSLVRRAKFWVEDAVEAATETGPFDVLHANQLGRALLAAIQDLPASQREAFLLKEEGELTLDEIALVTGASRETVKSRLRYAQRRLREALDTWR
ncbi:sigma-70 family RNA polymerase sigma factor [Roseiterribacter gracilis]|uniref:RNA polymerase sigma factor n=1 Tax=Roseiterribacter gracilis TaxID=2812848 RepID=A0A8S8XI83_9PROT|nr:RNA polymerase sigma factor [Rhodospirillales bacterium TMPK1]